MPNDSSANARKTEMRVWVKKENEYVRKETYAWKRT
jgi:hypothetical protein